MNPEIRRKKHRLPPEAYVGEVMVAFTICVEGRARLFKNPNTVQVAVEMLTIQLQRFDCRASIYCFMPNHIHLVVRGLRADSRPKAAVDAFKCKWASYLKRSGFQERMQHGYHDHIVRNRQDWKEQLWYILANPVRAGLVSNWSDYPFTGTIDCDLNSILNDLVW